MKIGVLGAGAIGCWLGGRLAHAGHQVVLVGREWMCRAVRDEGLQLVDLDGRGIEVQPEVSTDPGALTGCEATLVAVKGRDTVEAGRQLASVLQAGDLVWSCQNGLTNVERLREVLPEQRVLAGMVSFNVVRRGDASYQQGTSGPIAIEADPRAAELAAALRAAEFDVVQCADMSRVLASKLVFNVNNAVNALSDLPLREQLLIPGYRRVVAATMDEARAVLTASGMPPVRLGKLLPNLAPHALRLPTPLFRLVARSMLRIDPQARSSMWEDLTRGKPTEIDDLNGMVVRLGEARGIATPVNARLVHLVREAEAAGGSPGHPPEVLLGATGTSRS